MTMISRTPRQPPNPAAPQAPPPVHPHRRRHRRPPASQTPQKIALSLAEIANTSSTFDQFKAFTAKHGTAEQKKAVKHLKGWRSYVRKAYPVMEVNSDYPTLNYDALDNGDPKELQKSQNLEKQSQVIAEAFAAWWQIDEKSTLQVYNRGGMDIVGTACIRPDSVKHEGTCL
ncbi:hypothetical protein [Streptomyces sp. NBC_01578]|uniref:hypothetical protein n=1 Tax=Streptomyces sp. NBC_01578 TaxID=2975884 RepID=UPI00386C7610